MERTCEAPSNEAPHMILGYHQGRLGRTYGTISISINRQTGMSIFYAWFLHGFRKLNLQCFAMNWYFMGLGKGKGQLPIGLDNSLLHELSGIYNDDSSCFPCISPPVRYNISAFFIVLRDRRTPLHSSIRQFWASVSLMSVSTRWPEPFGEYLSR